MFRNAQVNSTVNLLRDTFLIHQVGFKAQHGEHDQRGQNRREEVDKRDEHGVKVAVVVHLVIAGEGDDSPKSQTEGKEDLCGRLPPNLWLQHLLQLQCSKTTSRSSLVLFFVFFWTQVRHASRVLAASITLGVNMCAIPSTDPFSIKPLTRKQRSTT